jgi:hypothetical protein
VTKPNDQTEHGVTLHPVLTHPRLRVRLALTSATSAKRGVTPMAITMDQALSANEFHSIGGHKHCTATVTKLGYRKVATVRIRRNGQTKVWKTRPNDFRIPVKYGLYECFYITPENAHQFCVAGECPVCAGE